MMEDKGKIRILCEGAFDIIHCGHGDLFRQAKELGDILIVNVHSDEEIKKHKRRTPLFNEKDRYRLVKAIKWVDEVIEGTPCNNDDNNIQSEIFLTLDLQNKNHSIGENRKCSRNFDVSSTQIIENILKKNKSDSDFMVTTKKILNFSNNCPIHETNKVVYVDGGFDIFHIGHLNFLEKVSKLGDYLIVGLHSDEEIKRSKGIDFPILNLHHRALNCLAFKYVDEVIFGAPFKITQSFMDDLKIDLVCHGSTKVDKTLNDEDPYEIPKSQNKFQIIDSQCDLSSVKIFQDIQNNSSL